MESRTRIPSPTDLPATPAAAPRAPSPMLGLTEPASVVALQRSAGNAAVTSLLLRDPAPAVAGAQPTPAGTQPAPAASGPPPPPPTGPVTPGQTANLGSPAAVEHVEPGVDLAADAQTVTVTAVLRNLNAGSIGSLDLLSEPNVSLVFAPGPQPQPVVQAAIAALNLHIRRHGTEVLSLTVSPQAAIGPSGPTAGAQAQAEYHVTTSFSLTATTAVTAQQHSDTPDPGSVRIGQAGPVDINWAPVSVGVLWHFGAGDDAHRPEAGSADTPDDARRASMDAWVRGQLDPADFDNGDPDPNANTRGSLAEFVSQLSDAMRAARGRDAAELQLPFARTRPPAGLTQGLRRAAALIAGADPSLGSLTAVRVSIITENAAGKRDVRWTFLPLR